MKRIFRTLSLLLVLPLLIGALPQSANDREYEKFVETSDGKVAVRVKVSSDSNIVQYAKTTSCYPEPDTDHVKVTGSVLGTAYAWKATYPLQSLTGSYTNGYRSAYISGSALKRFHIDVGTALVVTNVYYENYHDSGADTNIGFRAFTLWGSNDASSFNNTTYTADTGWTQLTTSVSELDQHTSSDTADPKYFTVTNTTAYRYYAFKFSTGWGSSSYRGIRRIELKTSSAHESPHDVTYEIPVFAASDGHSLMSTSVTWNDLVLDMATYTKLATQSGAGYIGFYDPQMWWYPSTTVNDALDAIGYRFLDYVPLTGVGQDVDLGTYTISAGRAIIGDTTSGEADGDPVDILTLKSLWNPALYFHPLEDPLVGARMYYDNATHEVYFNVWDGGYNHRYIWDSHGSYSADTLIANDNAFFHSAGFGINVSGTDNWVRIYDPTFNDHGVGISLDANGLFVYNFEDNINLLKLGGSNTDILRFYNSGGYYTTFNAINIADSDKSITFPNESGTMVLSNSFSETTIPMFDSFGGITDSPFKESQNDFIPETTDATQYLGGVYNYWAGAYTKNIYFNGADAYIDGVTTSGQIKYVAQLHDFVSQTTGNMASFTYYADHSSGSLLKLIKFRGTPSAPRRVRSADVVGGVNALGGYAANDSSTATVSSSAHGQFQFVATEAWTSTGRGTAFRISTTPIGSTTIAEAFRVDGDKNFKLAGTAVRGTTEGTNHLDIFDGTAPVGTLTNGFSLYSASGVPTVMDSSGNSNGLGQTSKPTFSGVIMTAPARLKGYTVATLPAGTQGDIAFVTDATAPTYLGALTGGGAVVTPVFYNGTAWVSY